MIPKPPSKSHSVWKGKEKATDEDTFDPDELNPIITYRHLHSNNLGVRDPLRVIALCDSDAFYAACEQVRLGVDPTLPLVVQQWDSLIAVNYPARKFGISRMCKVKEAKKLCPNLVIVHVATYKEGEKEAGYWDNPDTLTHKISLDHYRRESVKILQLFKDCLPGCEIERASIDEAFFDFTQPVREEILRRYPHLKNIPQDDPRGKDTPLPPPPKIQWDKLGVVIPVNPPLPPPEKNGASRSDTLGSVAMGHDEPSAPSKPAEACLEVETNEDSTWHDVALSIAAELMDKTRRDIQAKLGYTTSAGIARNKFLAKLTASYKKPMNQSILRNAAIPNYLRPLPFQKIRNLGGKLGKALADEFESSTVGDLLTVSIEEMQRKFGENSIWVYELFRGIDRSEVKAKPPVTKSMLASKNLPRPVVNTEQAHHWIRVLAAELAIRLADARETHPALWPKVIALHIRQGWQISKSKQAPFPFTRDASAEVVTAAGMKLWKELVDMRKTDIKITHVSLSFSGVDAMESGQQGIEGFLKPSSRGPPSSPPKLSVKRRRVSSPDPPATTDPTNQTQVASSTGSARAALEETERSFLCEKCGKRVALADEFGDAEDGVRAEALANLRLEHEDFHFAQDLANQPTDEPKQVIRPHAISQNRSGTKKPPVKKKRPNGAQGGIARFFDRS